MSDSEEVIQGKLAEYVDGTLAAEDAKAIEDHLAANPSHRALLEDLRRQSGLVRSLLRATAPADVSDEMQSQLERSALLEGGDVVGRMPVSIARWPQVYQVAAAVLLATGLGLAIYFSLPGSIGRPQDRVIAGNTTPAAAETDAATVPTQRTGAAPELALARSVESKDLPSGKPQETPRAAPAATPGPGLDVAATESVEVAVAGQPNPSAPEPVRSEAQDAIRGPAIPGWETPRPADEVAGANAAEAEQLGQSEEVPAGEAVFVVTPDPSLASSQVVDYLKSNAIEYDQPDAQTLLTQVAARAQFAEDREATSLPAAASGAGAGGERTANALAPAKLEGFADARLTNRNLIVARQMTRRQAMDLQTQLDQPPLRQRAVLYSQVDPDRPTEPPSLAELPGVLRQMGIPVKPDAAFDVVLKPGDDLKIRVEQLVGRGVDREAVYRLDSTGKLAMPMIEPIAAAGLTTTALRDRIVREYAAANLIPAATVSLERVAPATRPASGSAAPAAGAELDEPRADVVIVVQGDEPTSTQPTRSQPAAATSPATRPAAP